VQTFRSVFLLLLLCHNKHTKLLSILETSTSRQFAFDCQELHLPLKLEITCANEESNLWLIHNLKQHSKQRTHTHT